MAQRIVSVREQFDMLAPWLVTAAPVAVAPSSGGIVSGPGAALGADKPVAGAPDPIRDPRAKLPAAGLDYDGMVDNLVSHYHGSSDDQKKSGRLWYRVAHNLFANHAKDADVSHARAVAVGSATSPNTDWNENVKHAQTMLMHYRPNDADHNEHDWQVAHIHPQARADFQAVNGRDPTASDDDLHQLADLHGDKFKRGPSLNAQNDLSDPNARADWMQNIQHHGMDTILADHEKQVFDNRGKKDKAGNIVGYQPSMAMRDVMRKDLNMGGTLGNNVRSAKNIIRSNVDDPDEFARILGGPKVRNFSSNILDPTPMDSEGYLAHPNGDWTQHADLGGTIDAHHLRASTMAHGQWERKGYREEGSKLNPTDPFTYDVFNRGLLDATHRINSTIDDPTKHLTPKQVQAIIWIKHKGDNERFKAMPINHESELTPEIQQAHDMKMQKKQDAADRARQRQMQMAALEGRDYASMPPLWRHMFLTRQTPDWTDLLQAWVEHNSPSPGQDDGSEPGRDPADPRGQENDMPPQDPRLASVRDVLTYSAAVVKRSVDDFGPDWQRGVMKDVNETGGFSRRGPDKPPSKGFMVSVPGYEHVQPSSEVSGESIADYGRKHAPEMAKDPDLYQGGWGDEKDFYHDVSKHHNDIWDAAKAAYGEDDDSAQHAFYDINTGESPSPLELMRNGVPGFTMARKEEVDDWLTWT